MKRVFTRYLPTYTTAIIYMLQSSEYHVRTFGQWYWSVSDWRQIMLHGSLKKTKAAVSFLILFVCVQVITYIYVPLVWVLIDTNTVSEVVLKLLYLGVWVYAAPLLSVLILILIVSVARLMVQKPYYAWRAREARLIFAAHPAIKIGIAGSYGKTTMKHILSSVLGYQMEVAATSGNYNTPIGLGRFARQLTGSENVLILELGEYVPGDVRKLATISQPQIGVITGVNEQHMLRMRTIENTLQTIFELDDYLGQDGLLFINDESEHVELRLESRHIPYSRKSCDGWKVSEARADLQGTNFIASKGKRRLKIQSRLLGMHQIGPLTCSVAIADRLGLTDAQIVQAIDVIEPFKLRFESREVSGATIILDIYNGNPAGFMAGIAFLDDLPDKQAKRRIYVTPGIIELGHEAERIHREIGARLAESKIDQIVLVHNRVTGWILESLTEHGYKGEVRQIDNGPIFYENIDSYVRAGDVVILQNSPREEFFYRQK